MDGTRGLEYLANISAKDTPDTIDRCNVKQLR
jgi:hypothetical protein